MSAPSRFIQSGLLGQLGLITDPPDHTLPIGAWSEARNVRFRDGFIERVLEPQLIEGSEPVSGHPPIWVEQWVDNNGAQAVYASTTKLFKWEQSLSQWVDVTNVGGDYAPSDYWQSFAWGQSVVFNNESNKPQILYPNTSNFVDLPNWGLISSDPANPQRDIDTDARCRVLRPYGNFLVAINVRENTSAEDFPNRVWWSGPATKSNSPAAGDNPLWDYADLGSLSGIRDVANEDGPLVDQLQLGAVNIIYSQHSATSMQLTGDTTTIFTFNRALDYGVANTQAVAQFNNYHFCVSLDTVYTHDGSNMIPLIDGRVQDAFFGAEPDFEFIQVEHNIREKEIHTLLQFKTAGVSVAPERAIFLYNYKDNNFSVLDAFTDSGDNRRNITALSYGSRSPDNTTWADLTADGTTWEDLTNQGITWADFTADPSGQELFWIGNGGLYVVEQDEALNPEKRYYVARFHIDLSDLDPSITSDKWKQLTQVYPHISYGTSVGDSLTQITVSWSNTLQSPPLNPQVVQYDPQTQIKCDFRTTGRYLGLEVDVVGPGPWRMTSMDYEVQITYGR